MPRRPVAGWREARRRCRPARTAVLVKAISRLACNSSFWARGDPFVCEQCSRTATARHPLRTHGSPLFHLPVDLASRRTTHGNPACGRDSRRPDLADADRAALAGRQLLVRGGRRVPGNVSQLRWFRATTMKACYVRTLFRKPETYPPDSLLLPNPDVFPVGLGALALEADGAFG